MTISGFSFVRNGILFDYPFIESLQSILPLCDEFVIAVGNSSDNTLARIRSLNNTKIKIIETVWDESIRTGGTILAEQTDIALHHTSGDWAFYLQADEVVHEHDLPIIREAMALFLDDPSVEGLLFSYKHFYGSYRFVGNSRKWYRREIRVVRNGIGVRSWRDAQGFRIDSRKLHVKLIDASIYHYGWVKPPVIQQQKQETFNRLWHSDSWITEHVRRDEEYEYSNGGTLSVFEQTHPSVMKKRIEDQHWMFSYDQNKVKQKSKELLLNWIEQKSGYRFAEYKNYIII